MFSLSQSPHSLIQITTAFLVFAVAVTIMLIRSHFTVLSPDMQIIRPSVELKIWPADPPFTSAYECAYKTVVEQSLIASLQMVSSVSHANITCLHAASLYDPAPNIMIIKWKDLWYVVSDPQIKIPHTRSKKGGGVGAKEEEGDGSLNKRLVVHSSLKIPESIRIWEMTDEITLQFSYVRSLVVSIGPNPLNSLELKIDDQELAHCIQTINGL